MINHVNLNICQTNRHSIGILDMLPIEIIYTVVEFLSPFDIINFINVYPLRLRNSFEFDLNEQVVKYSDGYIFLVNIIHKIIEFEKQVDLEILSMIKEIVMILQKTSKYMDILGYSHYLFIVKQGSSALKIKNLLTDDCQVIYLIFPNIDKLCYYIDNYLNFTKSDTIEYEYRIRNYNVKQCLIKSKVIKIFYTLED